METQNNPAKYAFYYMLSLAALITMAIATGTIIFQIINKSIIDALNQFRGMYNPGAIKFAISALVISAPIFYLTSREIQKSLYSGALAAESGIRKWLTYFIIFVASVVMLGWLIATINSFLDGELTTKFILKSLTAIGIAAAIFTFYFHDIRRAAVAGEKDKTVSAYFYGSLVIVLAAFVASLFFVESPTETRNRKFDQALLENFNQLDNAIATYFNEEDKMPVDLDVLSSEYSYITNATLVDPGTGKKIEYKLTGENTYELCAEFRSANIDTDNRLEDFYKDRWPHDAGFQCLPQKVTEFDKGIAPIPVR